MLEIDKYYYDEHEQKWYENKVEKIWTEREFNLLPNERKTGRFVFYDNSIWWFKNGGLHNLYGPAFSASNGTVKFYIDNINLSEEEWNKQSYAILNNLEAFL